MPILTSEAERRRLLAGSRVIAVLGAHGERHRPAYYVPDYLHRVGYQVLPVNPFALGQTLWGQPVVAHLGDLVGQVDLVDVFRRSDALAAHLPELLAMEPLPRAVWFQVGVRDDAVASALAAQGIDVVQDACTMADHRRFGLGRVPG